MCFSHLLGFFYFLFFVLFITPAILPSAIKNSSILVVLSSFSSLYYSVIVLNLAANVSVDVCASHFFALLMYSATHSPSIQWCISVWSSASSNSSSGGVELCVEDGILAVVCCAGLGCGVVGIVVGVDVWWWVLSAVKGKWV
jgi:hypothetical protein